MNAGTVERRFHPHSALRSRQIGGLLGEILLESNQVSRHDLDAALQEQHHSRGQKLGELLEKNHAINREDLAIALKRQESMPVMRLGEALLQLKYITQEQLDAARAELAAISSKVSGTPWIAMIATDELRHLPSPGSPCRIAPRPSRLRGMRAPSSASRPWPRTSRCMPLIAPDCP
jgi:hypothetical protein